MKITNYSDYYKDPRWQKMRLYKLEEAHWECRGCGAKDKPFEVHHKFYINKHKPWEYEYKDLIVLCDDCHKRVHERIDAFEIISAEYAGLNKINGDFMWKLFRHVLTQPHSHFITEFLIDLGRGDWALCDYTEARTGLLKNYLKSAIARLDSVVIGHKSIGF